MTADEWMDEHVQTITSLAVGGGFPNVTRLTTIDLDLDVLFELGLRCLLDGLRSVLP